MNTHSESAATSVYRYFDAADQLLYVGVTGRGVRRQLEHARTKEWWPLVATCQVQHFQSRESALAEEAYQIKRHQPPFNTQGRVGPSRPLRIPILVLRGFLGRLSRQSSLSDVTVDFVVGTEITYRTLVQRELELTRESGGSLADLRDRLKRLAEH